MSWNQSGGGGKNPWGGSSGGGGGPRGSWGGGPGGGGQVPPDLDEMLRRAQENFRQILPGGMGPAKILAAFLGAFVVLWLASGFYLIEPNENGVVLTFGKYVRTEEMPGLKYRFPWPVQTVDVVNVTQERRIEVGFRDPAGTLRRAVGESVQDLAGESLMLTGDENIIDIDFVVLWRVGSARDFLYEIRDPEDTIKKVAESAMREVIGRTKIQMALTESRGQVQTETRALMQKMLDDYKAGVTINNVQLQKVDPPAPVVDAFNDVQRARADMERMRNEAEAYRNDILPRARGEAGKLRQDAAAYRQKTIDIAKGDASRFEAVYAAYKSSRDVTEKRIYIETLEQVLQNAKTVVLDSGAGRGGLMPVLPLSGSPRGGLPIPVPSGSPPTLSSTSSQGGGTP